MLLHLDRGDIEKLGIYDAAVLIENATVIKDRLEITILSAPGIVNPADFNQYSKYYKEPEETSIEEDMKEFEIILNVLKERDGGR